MKPKQKTQSFGIILGIVALNSIGYSIVLPLLPFIVGKYLPPQHVVVGMGLLLSVFAACTFFSAPVLGALSDKYGRKSILIISLSGSVIGYILFGAGNALWILFLGRIIDGITAGNMSTLLAYVSDSTDPDERTKWFGYIGSVMGIGKIGGPALGGFLGNINLALPFYVTAGLIFLSGLAVFYLLPESLPVQKRVKSIPLKNLNTFTHFRDMGSITGVSRLLVIGVLFYAALGIFHANFTLFLKENFAWGTVFIGAFLTIIGGCEITSRGLLLPFLLKRVSEKPIGMAGLAGFTIGLSLIYFSLYTHSIVVITLAVVAILFGEGLFDPTYNGRLSQSVDESKQGTLQGVNQSLQSANNMLIPLGVAAIYFYRPDMVYIIAAFIALITLTMFITIAPQKIITSNH